MLLARIAPSVVKVTNVQIRYASCQSVLLKSVAGVNKMSTSPIGRESNTLVGTPFISNSVNLIALKAFSTKPPELPSKQELEKYFFKVTVVVWDLIWKITMWSWAMCRKHIIMNSTVQSYWKTFNEKLEEARKN